MNFLRHPSIQLKLMSMLLLAAVASIVTVGWIVYSSGRTALTSAALDRLTSVRASRKIQIEALFKIIQRQAVNLADDLMIVSAMREMAHGFAELKEVTVEPEWDAKLRAFYQDDFLPKLAAGTGQTHNITDYLPQTLAARYGQYFYIAENPNPGDQRYKLTDAGDKSEFSVAHARYHSILSKFIQDFHYDNLILVNSKTGDVVYTYSKTPLFGTNLLTGPYSETTASALFRTLRKTTTVGETRVVDFAAAPYALGKPVALMGTAVFDGPHQIGVMLLQFPVDEINRVMTDNFAWVEDGLGQTGEVYLVGPDMLMRSRSRLLHEDPARYFKQLQDAGYSSDDIDRVRRAGTATLSQPVTTEAVESALSGKTGTAILTNYLGVSALSSFAPLDAFGLRWVVISEMESAEAFAPLTNLTVMIIVGSLGLVVIVAIVAALFGRGFVRPISRLLAGVQRLDAGEKNVSIDIGSKDEFADLEAAFNDMSRTLTTTSEALDQRTRERDELLDNIFPQVVAGRVKQGQAPVFDEYPKLSILYANFLALGDPDWSRAVETSAFVAELIIALDKAAEDRGVEKLSSDGTTYLACSGLSQQRPDDACRVVDFGQDILRIIDRHNRGRRTTMRVQIGIDSGPAVGGPLGRTRLSYHVLGETVSIAGALAGQAPPDTILVTDRVYSLTRTLYHFGAPVQAEPSLAEPLLAWPLIPSDRRPSDRRVVISAEADGAGPPHGVVRA